MLSRTALARIVACSPAIALLVVGQQADAQQRVVSACSGVSLPRSVVTDILSPVLTGITGPTETTVNSILNLPLIGVLLPLLNLNTTGLLAQAAAGNPITLQALASDGTIIGPADQCRVTADGITLDTPAGLAIGGNEITGLGANGVPAFAATIDAIAFGNNARAEAGATGSLALGTNSRVTAANSVALGAGSIAGRGALANYTASGLSGLQNSAGEVSIGAPGALRQLTNVAAGSAPTDAATVAQVDGVVAQVAGLAANAVQYDGAGRDRITLAGPTGTTIGNVAPGALGAASTEAVNGAQLFATNQAVGTNTAALVALDTRTTTNETQIGVLSTNVAANTGAIAGLQTGLATTNANVTNLTTQVGANTTAIADLQIGLAGTNANVGNLTAQVGTNTGAIAGLQTGLATTNTNVTNLTTQVGANTTAIVDINAALANQPVRYADAATPTTPNGGTVSDDATLAGASGGAVGLHNVRAGVLAAGSTDAVNGDQLNTTNVQVTANTTAITNFQNLVIGSAVSPVQYSDPATPTVPNGGMLTNHVTFVGAVAAPVALHNVAGGAVAAGSTDAVNGDQLAAVATIAGNGVQYDRDAGGARTNRVTLAGGNTAAPVTLANVAAGAVAATSTDAVNGGQLFATDQLARQAAAQGANSVQYDAGRTSVTFTNGANTPTTLHNVAAGTAATDAANVGQVQAGMQNVLAQANGYTDARLTDLRFDLRNVRRDLGAGTSAALAAAALPQANEPGRTMVAIGGGTYRGQSSVAIGASTFLDDGHSILRLGATYDSRGYGGANAGFGYQF